MKKIAVFLCILILPLCLVLSQQRNPVPETLLPLELLEEIINEASGDLALQNEIFLTAVNRNRLPEEYLKGYFETEFILKKLKEYGIEEAEIVELPTRSKETWDAEMGELWLVKPEKGKIADLKDIAASLCSGSSTTDTTAELVYVGSGERLSFYEGKDIKGKIVLVNGSPERARRLAVEKYEALGLIGYSSSHPEFDRDEVGWNSIRPSEKEKKTFAFVVSERTGEDLRDLLERGTKVEVRAISKAQMVPYKEEMVAALLKGKDYPEEELVFTAHLFEGFAKQGANDNASGCVAILETARVIKTLVDEGKIPPLKRSIRFLFVPEISGTAAYIQKFPEIAKRFFANINEDMVGEGLVKNNSYFRLITTPWSLPTCLTDVLSAFVEWVGTTQQLSGQRMVKPIVSPTGTSDPFYYSIDPYSGGSDHIVFVDGGVKVPANFFNVWPDMWYHSSGDTPDKSDTTQLKRAVFLSVAAAVFLANAGSPEVEKMIGETSAGALSRIGQDKSRAEKAIIKAEIKDIHSAYKEARNIIEQAFVRENGALSSIKFFIKADPNLDNYLAMRMKRFNESKLSSLGEIDEIYKYRCLKEKISAQKLALTQDEIRLSRLVPVRTEKMRGFFDFMKFAEERAKYKDLPAYNLRAAESEVRNFIDGKKSILEIRNAASAEFEPISLKDIENYIKVLEKIGFVVVKKK